MRVWRLGRRADLIESERAYNWEGEGWMDGRYESFFFLDVYNVIDNCIYLRARLGHREQSDQRSSCADDYADLSLFNYA